MCIALQRWYVHCIAQQDIDQGAWGQRIERSGNGGAGDNPDGESEGWKARGSRMSILTQRNSTSCFAERPTLL